jgi:hypothetical protein
MPNLTLLSGGKTATWWLVLGEFHFLPRDGSIPEGHRPIAPDTPRSGPFRRLGDVPDLEDGRFCDQCWREAYRRGVAPFGRQLP